MTAHLHCKQFLLGSALTVLFSAFPAYAKPSIWGALEPGRYAAGYRASFGIDQSRDGRPVLSAIWYPAAQEGSQTMTYRDYMQVPVLRQYPRFAMNAASEAMLKTKYAALTEGRRRSVDRLFASEAYARRDAPAATGRFPVVLYHAGAGGSFDENSVLFEFLASHGYVVISSAYQTDTSRVSNNVGGSERSVPDMWFLLKEAGRLPFVDTARVAAIGHSAGAQHLLEWVGQPDCPLTAMVSLDTTLEYTAEDFDGHLPLRRRLAELRPPRIPVLLVASADRAPNFETFARYLPNARRLAVRGLRHDDFVTHGMMRAFLPGVRGDAIRDGYRQVCETVLRFLREDANLL